MSASTGRTVLAFAHIGDLHLTDAKQRNFTDFLAIVAQIEMEGANQLDFVVLPGDNADNGKRSQYALAATALRMLSLPVHVLTGDHDMEGGSLEAFREVLSPEPLPHAVSVGGSRCLFLDISGPGSGGPDFRLGGEQLAWTERELRAAREGGETPVVFMHSYPADLKGPGEAEALTRLFGDTGVALVDLGHTHYNELANDGCTVFAATRSTGQIEEGPVGYSIATVDRGAVSWRFKPLDDAFPFVVITTPADHRLARGSIQTVSGPCEVRAMVLGRREITRVTCTAGDGAPVPMSFIPAEKLWSATVTLPAGETLPIRVEAVDATGRPGLHTILAAGTAYAPPSRPRDGSDACTVGAWPENGIMGTQLGPNRNGQPSS